MREIKFRAWDEENKKMIGPFQVGSRLSETWPPEMQYTGMKDKNGREMYEKDIVRHVDGWIGIVDYNPPGYWIYEVAGKESVEESVWSGNIRCEVIGNVRENPELVECANEGR